MSKLNNRYWLETDDFFKSAGTIAGKLEKEYCQLCFRILIHHWELLIRLYQGKKVFHKKLLSVENQPKCIQLSILICLSIMVKVFFRKLEEINCS